MAWRITALVRDRRGIRQEYLVEVGQKNKRLSKAGAETLVKRRLRTLGYTLLNFLGATNTLIRR